MKLSYKEERLIIKDNIVMIVRLACLASKIKVSSVETPLGRIYYSLQLSVFTTLFARIRSILFDTDETHDISISTLINNSEINLEKKSQLKKKLKRIRKRCEKFRQIASKALLHENRNERKAVIHKYQPPNFDELTTDLISIYSEVTGELINEKNIIKDFLIGLNQFPKSFTNFSI